MNFVSIRRKVISPVVIITTLAFASGGAALAYGLLVSYQSRAVVSFENSLSDFRTLQEQVNSVRVFDRYASADFAGGGSAAAVRNLVAGSAGWIAPVFRFSKKDARETGVVKDAAGLSDLVGYEIRASSAEPEAAQKKVNFLVNYVSDASLKIQLDNFLADSLSAKRLLLTSAALERDTEAYNLSLLEDRLNDLKRLARTYPVVATSAERQILSIEKNGERFMPLPMQMIAVERERFDTREKLAKTQRRVEGLPAEESLLAAHEEIAQKTNSGKDLALALVKDIQARIPNAKKGYEVIALLGYEDKYSRMLSNAFKPSRFIVAPTLPVLPVSSPLKITLLFGVLGALLALLWEFRASIMKMIQENRDEETAHDEVNFSAEAKRLHRA